MAYVALKPCCLAGKRFMIGESIPENVVHPGAVKNLLGMKIIAVQNGEAAEATKDTSESKIVIYVRADEGDMQLEPTAQGLQVVFDVLTSKAEDAISVVKEMTDEDALILLHVSDGRKAIRAAAAERAKELNPAVSDQTEG